MAAGPSPCPVVEWLDHSSCILPRATGNGRGPGRTGETPARSALARSEAAAAVHSLRDLTLDPLDELVQEPQAHPLARSQVDVRGAVSDGQLVEFADLLVEDAGGDETAGFADA